MQQQLTQDEPVVDFARQCGLLRASATAEGQTLSTTPTVPTSAAMQPRYLPAGTRPPPVARPQPAARPPRPATRPEPAPAPAASGAAAESALASLAPGSPEAVTLLGRRVLSRAAIPLLCDGNDDEALCEACSSTNALADAAQVALGWRVPGFRARPVDSEEERLNKLEAVAQELEKRQPGRDLGHLDPKGVLRGSPSAIYSILDALDAYVTKRAPRPPPPLVKLDAPEPPGFSAAVDVDFFLRKAAWLAVKNMPTCVPIDSGADMECAVCAEPFDARDRPRMMLPCEEDHGCSSAVCRNCTALRVITWGGGSDYQSCPLCRTPFLQTICSGRRVIINMPPEGQARETSEKGGNDDGDSKTATSSGGGGDGGRPPRGARSKWRALRSLLHSRRGWVTGELGELMFRVTLDGGGVRLEQGLALGVVDVHHSELLVANDEDRAQRAMDPPPQSVAAPAPALAAAVAAPRFAERPENTDAAQADADRRQDSAAAQERAASVVPPATTSPAQARAASAVSAKPSTTHASSSSSDSCSSYSLALTARALLEDAAQPPAHAFDVAKIALEVAGGLDATAAERGVSLARMVRSSAAIRLAGSAVAGSLAAKEALVPDPDACLKHAAEAIEIVEDGERQVNRQLNELKAVVPSGDYQKLFEAYATLQDSGRRAEGCVDWSRGAIEERDRTTNEMEAAADMADRDAEIADCQAEAYRRARTDVEVEREERELRVHQKKYLNELLERGKWKLDRQSNHLVYKRRICAYGSNEVKVQTYTMSATCSDGFHGTENQLASLRRLDTEARLKFFYDEKDDGNTSAQIVELHEIQAAIKKVDREIETKHANKMDLECRRVMIETSFDAWA